MSSRIFNRDDFQHPSDGWYQIEAKGEHPNRAAGVVQIIDDHAAEAIVNRFNADAEAGTLSHGHEMLIDIEHFKIQTDKETRAYGWLTELENRSDGIYGQIRWTATGKEAVDGGDYRFFSTEYAPEDFEALNSGKPKKARPLRLDGLTLTNMNNNKGQRPITNRAEAEPHRSQVETGYPEPAMEKWFQAVHSMRQGGSKSAGVALDFWQAWNLCKRQHEELYVAAFGSLSIDPFSDPAKQNNTTLTESAAADGAKKLTNRIQSEAGCTFGDAWAAAQSEAPVLFNIRPPAERMVNKSQAGSEDDHELRMEVTNYLRQLAEEEKKTSGGTFEQAWRRVCNRERAFDSVMCGRITGEQFLTVRPDLWARLARHINRG